jgi:Pirin
MEHKPVKSWSTIRLGRAIAAAILSSRGSAPMPFTPGRTMSIKTIQQLAPHLQDLGGFTARRLLPHDDRPMVGPFIFFDHLGPADFPPHQGVDVRPHPHINLATVTYLFEGALMHRDSTAQVVEFCLQPSRTD